MAKYTVKPSSKQDEKLELAESILLNKVAGYLSKAEGLPLNMRRVYSLTNSEIHEIILEALKTQKDPEKKEYGAKKIILDLSGLCAELKKQGISFENLKPLFDEAVDSTSSFSSTVAASAGDVALKGFPSAAKSKQQFVDPDLVAAFAASASASAASMQTKQQSTSGLLIGKALVTGAKDVASGVWQGCKMIYGQIDRGKEGLVHWSAYVNSKKEVHGLSATVDNQTITGQIEQEVKSNLDNIIQFCKIPRDFFRPEIKLSYWSYDRDKNEHTYYVNSDTLLVVTPGFKNLHYLKNNQPVVLDEKLHREIMAAYSSLPNSEKVDAKNKLVIAGYAPPPPPPRFTIFDNQGSSFVTSVVSDEKGGCYIRGKNASEQERVIHLYKDGRVTGFNEQGSLGHVEKAFYANRVAICNYFNRQDLLPEKHKPSSFGFFSGSKGAESGKGNVHEEPNSPQQNIK